MGNKLKPVALILSSLFMIVGLAACAGTQPGIPASTPPATHSVSRPNAQRPGNANSASTINRTGAITQPTNILPTNQANMVTGDGAVTVATYANLYFGSAGQITTINVNQGDRVTKGAVLAKLDTTSLEAALAQAKVNLDQAKLAQTQAESSLASAQFTLDETQAVSGIEDSITNDEWTIKAAQVNLDQARSSDDTTAVNTMTTYIANAQQDLDNQQKKLSALLGLAEYSGVASYDILGQTYDRLTIEDARAKELAVENAQQAVNKSQDTIDQAQENLDVAQQQLDQATITAPFDGLVAAVNQNVDDIIPAPAQSQHPVIYLIDPTTMELNIGVNELDVPKVKIGQKASVNVDAFPDIKLNGQVTAISPSPTVQGGLVDYTVTVSFSVPANVDIRIGMNGSASISTS